MYHMNGRAKSEGMGDEENISTRQGFPKASQGGKYVITSVIFSGIPSLRRRKYTKDGLKEGVTSVSV